MTYEARSGAQDFSAIERLISTDLISDNAVFELAQEQLGLDASDPAIQPDFLARLHYSFPAPEEEAAGIDSAEFIGMGFQLESYDAQRPEEISELGLNFAIYITYSWAS